MTGMTMAASLRHELAELRAAVGRLEAAPRLRLRVTAGRPRVLLGQPLSLAVAAHWVGQGSSISEEPARDLPLTVMTSWGMLRAADIYGQGEGLQVGTAVTTRTGLDGVARVTLLPPGLAQLDVTQQSALWTALDRLDADAATPADLQPHLAELVNAYRWEANLLLRQAVDSLHPANAAPPGDAVRPEDALAAWRQLHATVVALAAEDGQVTASGLAAVSVLDWLRPWLQIYRQQAQAGAELARDLARTRQRQRDPRALLDGIHRTVATYVNSEYGQIGREMGQRAAEHALRDFVQEGLADLPADTRVALFPTLQAAAETVTRAGVDVLSALAQARADLRQEIGDQAAVTGSLQQALAGKLDTSALQGFRSEIDASLNALDSQTRTLATQVTAASAAAASVLGQVNTLQASFGQLTTDLGALQGSLGDLSGRITDVASDLSSQLAARASAEDLAALRTSLQSSLAAALGQKADTAAVDGLRAELSGALAARVSQDEFASFQAANTAALNRKANAAALTSLRSELAAQLAGKADLAALDALRQETDGRLADLITSTDKITARMEEVSRSLADINDRFGGLRDEFRVQLDQNQQALAQALASVDQLQGSLGALPGDLVTRLATLEERTQGVSTSLDDFRTTVTALNRNFTSLNKRILDSGILRPPP